MCDIKQILKRKIQLPHFIIIIYIDLKKSLWLKFKEEKKIVQNAPHQSRDKLIHFTEFIAENINQEFVKVGLSRAANQRKSMSVKKV